MANLKNTPGITIEVLDNQLSAEISTTNGKLLLIGDVPGSSANIPDQPMLARNTTELREAIGDFIIDGKPNQLAIEWQVAMNESNLTVYVLPLKGATLKEKFLHLYGQLTDYMIDMQFDHVVLTGMYAGEYTDALTAADFTEQEDKDAFPALLGVVSLEKSTDKETGTYAGSPAHLIAGYAKRQSLESNQTIGYISTPQPTGFSVKDVSAHVKKLLGIQTEVSQYLQIYSAPNIGVSVEGSLRTQWSQSAAIYAAQVSRLPITTAPTNQPFKSGTQLRWVYSPRQIDQLIGHKCVVATIKNGQVIVVDAVTSAPDIKVGVETKKSDFTRLSTLRSMNRVVQRIRTAGDRFIGTTANFPTYTSLKTAIKSEIDEAIASGEIQDASFSIEMPGAFDTVTVKLSVIPTFELRRINVTIGLTDPVNYKTLEVTP